MFRLLVLVAFLGTFTLTGCGGPPEEKKDVVKAIKSTNEKKKILDESD